MKVYVAGHTGLVGSAVCRRLPHAITRTSSELDLTHQEAVAQFFAEENPDAVILCAAKVGGILANQQYPAEFIYQNLMIQSNVIHQAYLNQVKRLIFLGSSCIYPRVCSQPMKEEYLLQGELEKTNEPYAIAKIAGIQMCWAYNRQYGTQFLPVMPTNLYGPNDCYDLNNSHVLPALIRKFHEAKCENRPTVLLWGSGSPRREFLHSDDLAEAIILLLRSNVDFSERVLFNIGCGEDLSIQDLATLVAGIVGYEGKIEWDASKPDGTPQKLLDISKIKSMGWSPKIALKQGIESVYATEAL